MNNDRKPDEVDSFEYLSEHLYQRAKKGGFETEFTTLKTVLPYLNQFERLANLIGLIEQGDKRLCNYLLNDLIRLYRSRKDLRPAVVIIIIVILWSDLTEIYEALSERARYEERFADIYWYLLERLKRFVPGNRQDTRFRLVISLRYKFVLHTREEEE